MDNSILNNTRIHICPHCGLQYAIPIAKIKDNNSRDDKDTNPTDNPELICDKCDCGLLPQCQQDFSSEPNDPPIRYIC